MPWSCKRPEHRICACCGQSFPKAWLDTRKGVKDGRDEFCSPYCHSAYYDGIQPQLPLAFNGATFNRRIQ